MARPRLRPFIAGLVALGLLGAAQAGASASAAERAPGPTPTPVGVSGSDARPADADANRADPDDPAPDAAEPTPTPEPAPPPASLGTTGTGPTAAIDLDLQTALDDAGLLRRWVALAPTEPELALVAVEGTVADAGRETFLAAVGELNDARARVRALAESIRNTARRITATQASIADLDAEIDTLDDSIVEVRTTLTGLRSDLADVLDAMRGAAVSMYMSPSTSASTLTGTVDTYNAQANEQEIVDASIEELDRQRRGLESDIAREEATLADLEMRRAERVATREELREELTGLEVALDQLVTSLEETTIERDLIGERMPDAIRLAHEARQVGTVPALGFALVNLDAYLKASRDVVAVRPTCAIRWELIAGIARIESGHATHGGATVGPDGQVSQRILGVLLDGSVAGTAVIGDTDGGLLDGNAAFDAAVGPFQFIPGTWVRHALDATGDGFADPHNVYDAALTAAGYLCASSDADDDAAIARSVLSYNHSSVYLANVTTAAVGYAHDFGLPEPPLPDQVIAQIEARGGFGPSPLSLPYTED